MPSPVDPLEPASSLDEDFHTSVKVSECAAHTYVVLLLVGIQTRRRDEVLHTSAMATECFLAQCRLITFIIIIFCRFVLVG